MMRKAMFFASVIMLSSCASIQTERADFVNEMNHQIGQPIKGFIYGEPHEKKDFSEKNRYIYSFSLKRGVCSFYVDVEKDSDIIKKWGFISTPDNCYVETDWFGVW